MMNTKEINSLHSDILIRVDKTNFRLSECTVLSAGQKVNKGDKIVVKSFQITKIELSSGIAKKIKEVHILGKIYD